MRKPSLLVAAALLLTTLPLAPAAAQVPDGDPRDLPLFSNEVPRGSGEAVPVEGPAAAAKSIDGNIADWVGESSRFGGTALYSAGELVYQDHLFDAHGPDDGRDAARFEQTDALEDAYSGAYRLDSLAQADAPGELGIPAPDQFSYGDSYGDTDGHQDRLDLQQVRAALSGDTLALLARTTTMTGAGDTGLLVLADTVPGTTEYEVPFNSNLTTNVADVAVFVADGTVRVADLATGAVSSLAGASAVADPSGWNNALESALPLAAIGAADGSVSIAAATGKPDESRSAFADLTMEEFDPGPFGSATPGPTANVANVAFRLGEPVRYWLEKKQALALHDNSIDGFFLALDTQAMNSGASQEWIPSPGYHDRIFYSDPSTNVPQEGGRNGVFQHYGIFLPSAYRSEPVPLQWWLHWRGGDAHSGAAVVPKVFKQFGEDRDTIVVAPSGRGTSTWYVGRGHVDVLQVWKDVLDSFAIDESRVYVTGHSMGGWGSYLLTVLYPDRFAAAAPVAGPVTQGAWTGLDFPGCDNFESGGNTPCYIEANDSRPRDQHTRKLLENVRHVPYAILHGTSDELVPYSGVLRQHERLVQLGYRHRMYSYPGYEHYSHPIADQWAEAAAYLHRFAAPESPSRVTYKRDMPFERATEEVQAGNPNPNLSFSFDSAYWMSELTPADMTTGVASFDGRSLAIPEQPFTAAPDTGAPTAPGQTGPYVITGLQWIDAGSAPAASNAFDITLTGATAVRLDLAGMRIDPAQVIAGAVNTQNALELRLDGAWTVAPNVAIDGEPAAVSLTDGVAAVTVPAGTHSLVITPGVEQPAQIPTVLSLSVTGKGSKRTISATLTEADSGSPLVGETIVFSGNDTQIGTATTDEDGVATIDAPPGWRGNEITFTATFAGNDSYAGSSDSESV